MKNAKPPPRTLAGRRARPKLDLRLATLVELGPDAFGPRQDQLERSLHGFRRSGPLAFLAGRLADDGRESASALVAQVFVTVRDQGAFDRLSAAFDTRALRFLSRATTIATAEVDLARIGALEDHPDVIAIEWTGAFRPSAAAPADGPKIGPRAAIGLDRAPADLDGRGTIVGVVDLEGIDLYHPAFVDDHGRTRVRALWDQRAHQPGALSGRPQADQTAPLRQPYGRVHEREEIDRELSPTQRSRGEVVSHKALKGSHGTMTAGIAAGQCDDRPEARGVAPGADIVFVNTFGSGVGALGAMTELADGIAFIFRVADADGKPCAINVSLGDALGSRDGRSPVERFIDEMLADRPGRAVVIAAGNSAAERRHQAVRFGGEPRTLEIDVGYPNRDRAVIEIWYSLGEGREAAIDIEIEPPGNGGPLERVAPDGVPRALDRDGTRALVASARGVPGDAPGGPANGLIRIELLALEDGGALLSGIWKLHLFPRGGADEAHAWIDHSYIRFARPDEDTDATTLTTPGTARKAITVGAYDPAAGKPFFFSGRGPCRAEENKPDLAAPGGPLLVASASTTVRYVQAWGTSMATPLVTGAIALLFQRAKELRCEEIAAALFPGRSNGGDPAVGRGVLDLSRWLADGGGDAGRAAAGGGGSPSDKGSS